MKGLATLIMSNVWQWGSLPPHACALTSCCREEENEDEEEDESSGSDIDNQPLLPSFSLRRSLRNVSRLT